MKKFIYTLIWIGILASVFYYKDEIITFADNYIFPEPEIITYDKNEYASNSDFEFVQITDDFFVSNIQEIKNVYYTVLANGWDKFTFYCDREYLQCLTDVSTLASDSDILNAINNYVHPYNSYDFIETASSTAKGGTITVRVKKTYSTSEINIINAEMQKIVDSKIKTNMSVREKIEAFHDYLIDNTVYDNTFDPEVENNTYKSNIAYGALIQGEAICGGYTDAVSIFLHRLGIKNYKISSENHIWNYLYLENDKAWFHLDATWDDPEGSNISERIRKKYFLIQTHTLLENDKTQHTFDTELYLETE